MTPQFKNRLVGITIVVALVVIFLPSLIDGEKKSYQQEFVATPINPPLQEHTINSHETENHTAASADNDFVDETSDWEIQEVASTVVVDESIDKVEKSSSPQDKVPATVVKASTAVVKPAKKIEEPKKKVNFTEAAWTIQLGAFQNKNNINTLLATLRKEGFQVHTVPKSVVDGQLTRVFVGPDISKVKLEKKLPRLLSLTSLKGKLVPFDPLEP